ncbi:MAG: hypothetical protein K2W95_12145 [Candidatus Obscuribacterales bacterium]|nr:hypothetical protein [Candidatus Obscuribacterales bacterium]
MFGDICAVIAVLLILGAVMYGLYLYQRARQPHPEIIRKLVHAVMGLVTLSFPFVFQSSVSVVLLALIAGAGLSFVKHSHKLQDGVGGVLCAVKRKSYGEVSFVAAIAVLFLLAQHQPLFYVIPVLILTLADSLSALVGVFMGRRRFTTSDGTKSAEGSFVFFVTTLLATAVPLFIFSSFAPAKIILIGLLLGGLVMMFEAISWRGLDNFLIPISAFGLLSIYVTMDLNALIARFIVAAVLLMFALVWRKRTTLHDGAVIGAALACYASTAVGGVEWLLAPMTVFSLYKLALPERYHSMARVHSVRAVVSVASIGLLWLLLSRLTNNAELFFPYTLSFALHFAIIGTVHLQKLIRSSFLLNNFLRLAQTAAMSWIVFFLPYLAVSGFCAERARQALIALPIILLATLVFYCLRPGDQRQKLAGNSRWARQVGVVACVSPLALCYL